MQDKAFHPVSKFQEWAERKAGRAKLFKTLGAGYLAAFIRCTIGACNGCNKRAKACTCCPLNILSEQAESTVLAKNIDARKTITKGEVIYKEQQCP
jgi:hypothetical protein